MTTTKTADVEGTLQQIYALAGAGCDIVRCTCNEPEAAEGLAQIVPRSPLPVVADIHFQYKLALAALDAGVDQLRLNPGNIRKPEHIRAVAAEARDRGISTRIGVNAGSLDPELEEQYGVQLAGRDGRVGQEGDRLLRGRRLRPHRDLGEVVEPEGDDRGLPVARRRHRPPAAPRRHRGRTDAPGPREGDRGHRHAAHGGHRRHHPLLADRRPGRGGQGRPVSSRASACGSGGGST